MTGINMSVEDAIKKFKDHGYQANWALGSIEVIDGTRTLTTVWCKHHEGLSQEAFDAALIVANKRKAEILVQK